MACTSMFKSMVASEVPQRASATTPRADDDVQCYPLQ